VNGCRSRRAGKPSLVRILRNSRTETASSRVTWSLPRCIASCRDRLVRVESAAGGGLRDWREIALWALPARLARRATRVQLAPKDLRASMVPGARTGHGGCGGYGAHGACGAIRGRGEYQETLVGQAPWDSLALQAGPVRRASRGSTACQADAASVVWMARPGSKVCRAPQGQRAKRGSRAGLDPPGQGVTKVSLAALVPRVQGVLRGPVGCRVRQAPLVPADQRVLLGQQALQACQVLWEQTARWERLACRANTLLDRLVPMVWPGLWVHQASLVRLAPPAPLAKMARQALQVLLGLRAQTARQARQRMVWMPKWVCPSVASVTSSPHRTFGVVGVPRIRITRRVRELACRLRVGATRLDRRRVLSRRLNMSAGPGVATCLVTKIRSLSRLCFSLALSMSGFHLLVSVVIASVSPDLQ
jgi:hypothetical protein